MAALLVFAVLLIAVVLLSDLFRSTVLSAPVVFLLGGVVVGPAALDWVRVSPFDAAVATLVRATLVLVLLSDGMKLSRRTLRDVWRLPGRALVIAMPLTIALTALFARMVLGLSLGECVLVGAALAPTDPLLAASLVQAEETPPSLRRLINIESGLNDGIALPVIMVTLGCIGWTPWHSWSIVAELLGGVALGVVVPWLLVRVRRLPVFSVHQRYAPFTTVGVGLLLLSLCELTHANAFLAAFVAGITLRSTDERTREEFETFGEHVSDLAKVIAIFVFGIVFSTHAAAVMTWQVSLFVALVLILARPPAMFVSMWKTGLSRRQRLVGAWFGPKGLASVLFGLMIMRRAHEHGVPPAEVDRVFQAVAAVVVASIVVHSTTDVPAAHWLARHRES